MGHFSHHAIIQTALFHVLKRRWKQLGVLRQQLFVQEGFPHHSNPQCTHLFTFRAWKWDLITSAHSHCNARREWKYLELSICYWTNQGACSALDHFHLEFRIKKTFYPNMDISVYLKNDYLLIYNTYCCQFFRTLTWRTWGVNSIQLFLITIRFLLLTSLSLIQ